MNVGSRLPLDPETRKACADMDVALSRGALNRNQQRVPDALPHPRPCACAPGGWGGGSAQRDLRGTSLPTAQTSRQGSDSLLHRSPVHRELTASPLSRDSQQHKQPVLALVHLCDKCRAEQAGTDQQHTGSLGDLGPLPHPSQGHGVGTGVPRDKELTTWGVSLMDVTVGQRKGAEQT